jgi:hypothetical protein
MLAGKWFYTRFKYGILTAAIMKTIILFCLSILLTLTGYSQKERGVTGAMLLGYAVAPGSARAFERMSGNSIPGLHDNYVTIGLNTSYRSGRIILGLNGWVGAQRTYHSDEQRLTPFIGSAHTRFGYVVRKGMNHWIYPAAGVGAGWMDFNSYYRDSDGKYRTQADAYLFSPSMEITLNGEWVLNQADQDENPFSAILLGLSIGYRTSPVNDTWFDQHSSLVRNHPRYRIHGYFITLSFGGGSFWR